MRLHWRALGSVFALLCALLTAVPIANAASTSGNLIVNGDAEAGYCTTDWTAATTMPGWTIQSGSPDVVCYSAGSFAHPATPAPGKAFFAPGNQGDGSLSQTEDVSSAAGAIDGAGVSYNLSGWLGGWASYAGYVQVSLRFQNGAGRQLGATANLPTVSAADRSNTTSFLARSATGGPAGTRSIQVQVQFVQSSGESGYLDNLSLTLSTPVTTAVLTPPASQVPGYDHVFTVMMENTNYSAVMGDTADTLYLHSLMAKGANLTDYHGVYHPSDENYLAVAGGDTNVSGAIYWPNIKDPGTNLGDLLEAKGKTWKAYEQGMGTPATPASSTTATTPRTTRRSSTTPTSAAIRPAARPTCSTPAS